MQPMAENYTTNDLILYLYNETELTDTVFVQNAIDNDDYIAEEYAQLVAVKQLLDYLPAMPSATTVDSIMAYSKLHSYVS